MGSAYGESLAVTWDKGGWGVRKTGNGKPKLGKETRTRIRNFRIQ